jgi:hypothetical protein
MKLQWRSEPIITNYNVLLTQLEVKPIMQLVVRYTTIKQQLTC